MKILLIYAAIVNAAALAAMGIDKLKAIKQLWRIPEKTLFLLAAIGGSVGALIGMYLFRHKIRKWYFVVGMPAILIAQISLIVWLAVR